MSNETNQKKGVLYILSGPSGAGKTTLCKMVEKHLGIPHSVSFTTRPKRLGEVHGKDYHFVSEEEFDRMIAEEEFLEWAFVHGHRYGTGSLLIEERLSRGEDFILDLDTQGAIQVKEKRGDVLLIFLDLSDEDLLDRLNKRGTDDPEVVKKRLQRAQDERQAVHQYDHRLINHDLDSTFLKIMELIQKKN